MKRQVLLLHWLLLLPLLFSISAVAQFRVVAYLPTWVSPATAIAQVDLNKLTHLNIAFSNPGDNTGAVLTPADGLTTAQITTIVNACHAKNVKVFMSIGGSTTTTIAGYYQAILGNAAQQTIFVTTLRDFVSNHHLDGIDVDIEGDVLDGTHVTDVEYESFVTALADTLHNHGKLVSAALATWFDNFVTNTAASRFDWVNVMSYDAYGTWTGPGPHSPYSLATDDFYTWNVDKAVPASQLNIGMPFYGYGWGSYVTTDEMAYCDIVNTYTGAENTDSVGSSASGNMISYNGLPTIIQKTKYALAHAGGVMIWQITEDCASSDHRSLLRAIDSLVHPLTVTAIYNHPSSLQQLNVFPNPTSGQVQVQLNLPSASNGSLTLCDLNGVALQELLSGTLDAQGQYNLQLSGYHSGLYLLKLVTDNGIQVQKISKQ
jgi:chitinase